MEIPEDLKIFVPEIIFVKCIFIARDFAVPGFLDFGDDPEIRNRGVNVPFGSYAAFERNLEQPRHNEACAFEFGFVVEVGEITPSD